MLNIHLGLINFNLGYAYHKWNKDSENLYMTNSRGYRHVTKLFPHLHKHKPMLWHNVGTCYNSLSKINMFARLYIFDILKARTNSVNKARNFMYSVNPF
jgi:lysozyme family protein